MNKVYKALFYSESSQVDQYTSGDLVSREENHIHTPHPHLTYHDNCITNKLCGCFHLPSLINKLGYFRLTMELENKFHNFHLQ